MSEIRQNHIRLNIQSWCSALAVLAILIGFACKKWFPQFWTDWYVVSIVVFWLIEMVMSFILEGFEGQMTKSTPEGKKFMKVYMYSKLAKVLLTIILIGVGIYYIGSANNQPTIFFALGAVALYLLNLGVETFFVTKQMNKEKGK